MNWRAGLVLRIKQYKFEDDGSTRDKYSIVLFVDEQEAILIHCLTTSQNNHAVDANKFGCCVHKNAFPFFCFPAGQIIGDRDFFFEKDTFVFFSNNVRQESFGKLEMAEKNLFGLVDLGTLDPDNLRRLIKCALKSKFLPSAIADKLKSFKSSI